MGLKRQRSSSTDEEAGRASRKKNSSWTNPTKKIPWSALEDKRLISVVESTCTERYPDGSLKIDFSWGEIAELIPNRNSKQCRERWCYNLDPAIKREAWIVQEDAILMKAQQVHGNQWAIIARYLKGRTENSVKTRHKSIMRAQKREWTEKEDMMIKEMHRRLGSQWEKYNLPGRTANAVKTRFNTIRKGYPVETPTTGSPRQIWHQMDLIDKVDLEKVLRFEAFSSGKLHILDTKADTCIQQAGGVVSKKDDPYLQRSSNIHSVNQYTIPLQLEFASAQLVNVMKEKNRMMGLHPALVKNSNEFLENSVCNERVRSNNLIQCLQVLQSEILQDKGLKAQVRSKLLTKAHEIASIYLGNDGMTHAFPMKQNNNVSLQTLCRKVVASRALHNRQQTMMLGNPAPASLHFSPHLQTVNTFSVAEKVAQKTILPAIQKY